jgi:heme/copper-type cytochrome/quinol oxidase subunit 4
MAYLTAVLASSTDDAGGWGLLAILATLVVIALMIAAVWVFAARRGNRMPERTPQRRDHGVRGS